jgi:type IV pilus assembly protein PilE
MHKRLSGSGFTLTELLVIIVIIGILATMAFLGYNAYIKNSQNAQIASTVSSYQDAINSMKSEQNIQANDYTELTVCLSSTSDTAVCCFLVNVDAGGNMTHGCNNNTTFANFTSGTTFGGGAGYTTTYTASQLSAWTRKYLRSTPPTLPVIPSTAPACTASTGTLYTTLPCSTRNIGMQVFFLSDGSSKTYLHYYLPGDRDCQSKEVVTVSASSGPVLNKAA